VPTHTVSNKEQVDSGVAGVLVGRSNFPNIACRVGNGFDSQGGYALNSKVVWPIRTWAFMATGCGVETF
jgi:hypothetical protein